MGGEIAIFPSYSISRTGNFCENSIGPVRPLTSNRPSSPISAIRENRNVAIRCIPCSGTETDAGRNGFRPLNTISVEASNSASIRRAPCVIIVVGNPAISMTCSAGSSRNNACARGSSSGSLLRRAFTSCGSAR